MSADTTKDDLVKDCGESLRVIAEKWGLTVQSEWLKKLNREELDNFSSFLDNVWQEIRE